MKCEGDHNLRGDRDMKQHYAHPNMKSLCVLLCVVVLLWRGVKENMTLAINAEHLQNKQIIVFKVYKRVFDLIQTLNKWCHCYAAVGLPNVPGVVGLAC